jgi:hypothetical protein
LPAPLTTRAWNLEALRLPKAIDSDPGGPALHAALQRSARKLWAQGIALPTAAWSPELGSALADALRERQLVRGLGLVEKTLEREARGLSMADARSSTERGSRVSRLVLVSNDGTERFYRQVEQLLFAHGARVLAIQVGADSAQFARVVPDASGVVRALMLEHKEGVAHVLRVLYGAAHSES